MVKLNDPWAKVKGYCPSVPAAMQRHLLLVAPLRYGAGVKGKEHAARWREQAITDGVLDPPA